MTITLNGTSGIVNDATDLNYTGTLTGGTGVVNLGSGQVYKDASGNVGIGTSTPKKKLTVSDASSASTTPGTNPVIWVGGGNVTANTLSEIGFTYGANSWSESNVPATVGFQLTSTVGFGKGALTFCTRDVTTDTAPTERARIDSSGSLLVGTTATAANAKLEVKNNSGLVVYFYNDAGTGVYLGAGATSWTAASDARIKTALVPFENAAEKVCTLRAGTGRYLADEETVSRSFLIAQDVQAVLPEAVNVRDDEIGTLGLQYTDVIPLLVAAIQEQQTLITALTARITALEAI